MSKAAKLKTTDDIEGFTPVAKLRAGARKDIESGAITKTYTIDREKVITMLNAALATEWVCALRYYRHYYMATGMINDAVKGEFIEHAKEELQHADMLAERIVQLGGEPDLNPDHLTKLSHAEYKEGSNLKEMVIENLIAERIAIDSYREMINFIGEADSTTRRMLESILEMEEEHADDLSDMIEGWMGEKS